MQRNGVTEVVTNIVVNISKKQYTSVWYFQKYICQI